MQARDQRQAEVAGGQRVTSSARRAIGVDQVVVADFKEMAHLEGEARVGHPAQGPVLGPHAPGPDSLGQVPRGQ